MDANTVADAGTAASNTDIASTAGNILDIIGVKAGVVFAGFAGGLARVAFLGSGGAKVTATIFSVLGGTVTAIYLGPVGPTYLGWQDNARSTLAVTFLVGAFGMEIFRQIGVAVGRWSPTITFGKGQKDV